MIAYKHLVRNIALITLFIFIFLNSLPAQQGAYQAETEDTKAERMQWYEDARFGMFIHWGVYSQLDGEYKGVKQKQPKGEWVMRYLKIPVEEYATEIASKFNPKHFDADKWAKSASDAGMKYLVITTKHHDGFALFDSEVSDFNIVDATDFKRDIIKELADACKKYGLKFGIYYSQAQDWHHPGGLAPKQRWDKNQEGEWSEYFRTIVKGQVTELFTNYGEIALVWWDSGRATQNKEVADEVGSELVKLQPSIIVNPRLGGNLKGDFNTYEQVIPGVLVNNYNELCITNNRSWSYKASDLDWKDPAFLLKTMVHMASLGGNFLFNVGPDPDGNFPKQTMEALDYIGHWMETNKEAIYSTKASPFYKLDFGEATMKTEEESTKIYFHVYDWPSDQKLFVPGLHNRITSAYLLQGNQHLKTVTESDGLYITDLPKSAPHDAVSVIVLEIEEPLDIDFGYIKPMNGDISLTPLNALLTIKPQYDEIPMVVRSNGRVYFDQWKNHFPHPRFKNTGNQAHWKVDVPQKATYKVFAECATENDKNVISLKAGNQLTLTLPDTGGMDNFKSIELGELKLRKGINTITFTGGKKNEIWDFVRLSEINLEKVP